MALANQKKHLLLSTGNKSELAVGYCTLYGDMNGGLSVIGDLYKTSVFDLCNWIDNKSSSSCRNDFFLPEIGEIIGTEIRNQDGLHVRVASHHRPRFVGQNIQGGVCRLNQAPLQLDRSQQAQQP